MRTFLAGAFLCASLLAAAPASAEPLYAGYNDRQNYDVTLQQSGASFEARVRLAARQSCGQRAGQVTLREWRTIRECKRQFIQGARATAS